MLRVGVLMASLLALALPVAAEVTCVDCHNGITPGLVADWATSRHSEVGVELRRLPRRGAQLRRRRRPWRRSRPPRPAPSATRSRSTQFQKGKHALAWAAMKAMPTPTPSRWP